MRPILPALLFAALSAMAQPAVAQERLPSIQRQITVAGEAEIRVAPDQVSLQLTIANDDKDLDKARAENDQRVKRVLATVRGLGIDAKDVQTDYLRIEPRYGKGSIFDSRDFLGFFVIRTISVRIGDLAKFEPVVAEALKAGANQMFQGPLTSSELRQHRDRARLLAAKAAREKAQALALELGAKLGPALLISEDAIQVANPRAQMQNVTREAYDGGGEPGESALAVGQIAVRARVNVVFALE